MASKDSERQREKELNLGINSKIYEVVLLLN